MKQMIAITMLVLVVLLIRGRAEDSVPLGHEPRVVCTAAAMTQSPRGNLVEQTIMEWEGWSTVRYRLPNEVSVGYGTRLSLDMQPVLSAISGGRLDYREVPERAGGPVCLTFEFPGAEEAQAAAESLREHGEHVEGPAEYGV